MDDIAQGVLTGVAIGGFAAAVVKVNMFVIDKLSMLNNIALETTVGMALNALEIIKFRRQRLQRLQLIAADEGNSTVVKSES